MSQQQGQHSADAHLNYLWVILGLTAVIIIIWFFDHSFIVAVIYRIKLFELNIIGLFTDNLVGYKDWIYNTPPTEASFAQVYNLITQVGNYLRYPIGLGLFILAIIIFSTHPGSRHKKVYDMEKLVRAEKKHWPQITPVVNKNLVDTNLEEGEWAMAMTPLQFAKHYHLLQITRIAASEDKLEKEAKLELSINRGMANRILSLQLGRLWKGGDALPMHAKALFAVFAAKANRDSEPAVKLLAQMAASSAQGKIDFSNTEELLAKHSHQKNVLALCNKHAYETTVLASMLELAREDGVLASADFLWLKPVDRKLWYILNTVGRRTVVPEVAGIFAHWIAEKELGKRMVAPMVEQAVLGLELAMREVIYKPKDDEVIH